MKRAKVIAASIGILVLALSLIGCGQGADDDGRTARQGEYAPLEYLLGADWGREDGNTSNLRFQTSDGHVTFRIYLDFLVEKTAGTPQTELVVRAERINAIQLELHTSTKGELQRGDIVEVTIDGQFPGSPIEAAGVFNGLVDSRHDYQVNAPAREFIEDFFRDEGGAHDWLFTLTEHERS